MRINRHLGNCKWDSITVLPYKEEGTHFKSISRQVLFEGTSALPCELRYFEISEAGHSTLERHEHLHVIMVIKGSGEALVGNEIIALKTFDVLQIPQFNWHQLRANNNEALGFLCLVNNVRDRPQRPELQDIEMLKSNPQVASFIRI